MKKQSWINKHLDKHLSLEPSTPKLKKKVHKLKTIIREIFRRNVPENIHEIEDKNKVLVIYDEIKPLHKVWNIFSKKKKEEKIEPLEET